MRTRLLNSNTELPVIGQGTWKLEEADRHLVDQTLNVGIDAGMSHIDTAEMYGDGAVEELLGTVLVPRRDELFVASKVLPENATFDGTLRACERSLRRLRTDRLDLYLLHGPVSIPWKAPSRHSGGFRRKARSGSGGQQLHAA
jgi:diketogulonate reductase-like aldo/keto reductase